MIQRRKGISVIERIGSQQMIHVKSILQVEKKMAAKRIPPEIIHHQDNHFVGFLGRTVSNVAETNTNKRNKDLARGDCCVEVSLAVCSMTIQLTN